MRATYSLLKYDPALGMQREYDVSFGSSAFLESAGGLYIPDNHRLSERGPFQNGSTDLGYRLDERMLEFSLVVTAETEPLLEQKLDDLALALAPDSRPISLRKYRADGRTRQIDLFIRDSIAAPMSDLGWGDVWSQRLAIAAVAPDPIWYSPTLSSVPFGIAVSGGAWAIPWAIPWSIGSSTLDQTVNVAYAGSWEEYPIIIIQGPITSPIITNTTTGDKLDFTGTVLGVSDTLTINLRYGQKTVVDQTGANRIAALVSGSSLSSWRLLSRRDVAGGINTIRVQGTAGGTQTQIYLQYNERYISA